jgi:hypothetical protein
MLGKAELRFSGDETLANCRYQCRRSAITSEMVRQIFMLHESWINELSVNTTVPQRSQMERDDKDVGKKHCRIWTRLYKVDISITQL